MTAGIAVLIRCQARRRSSIGFSCPEREISFSSGNAVIPHTCGSMFLRCFFKFSCNSFIEIQMTAYIDNRKYNRYEKIRSFHIAWRMIGIDKRKKYNIIKTVKQKEWHIMNIALKSGNSRKSDDIVRVLREQILSGILQPGTRVMSARELGRHFNVSLVTANKALHELAQENLIVRNERSGSFVRKNCRMKNYRIGFADNINIFRAEIQPSCGLYRDTCIQMLYENGCGVRFLKIEDVPEAVLEHEVDGVLCYYGNWSNELMMRMKKNGIPVVLGRFDFVLNTPFHQVLPDIYGAAYEVFHRIDRAHFDGLIIVYEDHANCLYRRDVALELAHHAGFKDSDIQLVKVAHREIEMNYPVWVEISRHCNRKFIYACGDVMASGLVRVLQAARIELGKKVQLASCGNLEDCGYQPFDEPTITGAGVSYVKYGQTAVELLMRVLKSPKENELSQIVRVPAVYRKRKTAFQ